MKFYITISKKENSNISESIYALLQEDLSGTIIESSEIKSIENIFNKRCERYHSLESAKLTFTSSTTAELGPITIHLNKVKTPILLLSSELPEIKVLKTLFDIFEPVKAVGESTHQYTTSEIKDVIGDFFTTDRPLQVPVITNYLLDAGFIFKAIPGKMGLSIKWLFKEK